MSDRAAALTAILSASAVLLGCCVALGQLVPRFLVKLWRELRP